jgi:hypothetical protein
VITNNQDSFINRNPFKIQHRYFRANCAKQAARQMQGRIVVHAWNRLDQVRRRSDLILKLEAGIAVGWVREAGGSRSRQIGMIRVC